MSIPYESIESSSPIITRAVSAGLSGCNFDVYEFPVWQRLALQALGYFPKGLGRIAISSFQAFSGLHPKNLNDFSLDLLIQKRLEDYAIIKRKFPAIVMGAGMGGAASYLSLALDAPFLPQAFVITLKGGSFRADVNEYLTRSVDAALSIAGKDGRLMTIQHFDPIHDGWLVRYVNHLRFKLIELPESYAEYILEHLMPGGSIIFLNGGARWLRYRIGERSVFQIGGWGDIGAEEYLTGSPRLELYAKQNGLKYTKWSLPNDKYSLENGPESEWGCEPGLAEALQRFCEQHGFQFTMMTFPDPNDFSRLAFYTAKKLINKNGREPQGTLVECFSQFDSVSALQGGLLPLWLIFNTTDSARYLKEMSPLFPANRPVFFSPLATFSLTPDMATWADWCDALGRDFINIGARESHYPSDAHALLYWQASLRNWVNQNKHPLSTYLTPQELVSIDLSDKSPN